MTVTRRATNMDSTWNRAWTIDLVSELPSIKNERRGDRAYCNENATWYVRFDGATGWQPVKIIGTGSATMNWGSTPTLEGAVTITGQSQMLPTAQIRAWFQGTTVEAGRVDLTCSGPAANVGFTVNALSHQGLYTGSVAVQWKWEN